MKNNKMLLMNDKGLLIVLSGPSGVGKGTIAKKVLSEINGWESVSMTTRNPRDGEMDGKDYYFVNKLEFEKRIKDGMLIEYAMYNDNYYGTPKDKLLEHIDDGIDSLLEIEVQGAKNIKEIFNDAVLIYLFPPSFDDLRDRLIKRGTESKEEIEKRISIVKKEIEYLDVYDYVVVNDDLDEAVKNVMNIINSEKMRVSRIKRVNI